MINIGDIDLGSEILVGIDYCGYIVNINDLNVSEEVPVIVIGKYYYGEMCIGWNNMLLLKRVGRPTDGSSNSWTSFPEKYFMIKEAKTFQFHTWIEPKTIVKLYNKIIHPNQKCVCCNLPAPHCNPNMPDNKFQCVCCKVLETLG
jgi:hypothetical protein